MKNNRHLVKSLDNGNVAYYPNFLFERGLILKPEDLGLLSKKEKQDKLLASLAVPIAIAASLSKFFLLIFLLLIISHKISINLLFKNQQTTGSRLSLPDYQAIRASYLTKRQAVINIFVSILSTCPAIWLIADDPSNFSSTVLALLVCVFAAYFVLINVNFVYFSNKSGTNKTKV